MKEIKITIKGHLNEPIRGLACHDFSIDDHDIIATTEDPEGMYTLYFNKNIHPVIKQILKAIKYIKSLFN